MAGHPITNTARVHMYILGLGCRLKNPICSTTGCVTGTREYSKIIRRQRCSSSPRRALAVRLHQQPEIVLACVNVVSEYACSTNTSDVMERKTVYRKNIFFGRRTRDARRSKQSGVLVHLDVTLLLTRRCFYSDPDIRLQLDPARRSTLIPRPYLLHIPNYSLR